MKLEKKWPFDRQWIRDFTARRQTFVAEFLRNAQPQIGSGSALDVGCGLGDFSKFLSDLGFRVMAVDGREENVSEAKRRYPEISYRTANIEDLPIAEMGTFDLVLCFGLLYHLENPFRAIRNLYSLTQKILLIETMCIPGSETTMQLLDEGRVEDQGLNYVAFYPSESSLIKMLYRAGFPFVYRFERLPPDELYTATLWRKRLRTVLAASKAPLTAPNLLLAKDQLRPVPGPSDPWTTPLSRLRHICKTNLFQSRVFVASFLKPARRRTDSTPHETTSLNHDDCLQMTLSASSATEPIMAAEPSHVRASQEVWPRITLVTAVYNGEKYLEETICSVVHQRYPNLEYIVVDDGSTDHTVEIIKKYEQHLAWWVSQPNRGLYASLNTGFARSSGEIMGWINANDKLHTNGLFAVGSVFKDLPTVEWITGRPTYFNEAGMTIAVLDQVRWSRYRFLVSTSAGIQQESTMWRRSLWEKAGGYVDDSGRYGHVSDFELWVRFFRHAKLYPVNALIAGYRFHGDSIGLQNMDRWQCVHGEIIEAELSHVRWGRPVKLFRRITRALKPIPVARGVWRRIALKSVYHLAGFDLPPIIEYQEGGWHMRER